MKPVRMILLEYNELSPPIMERFIADGHLPNFRRFLDESEIYVTDAEVEGGDEQLEPWVQWVTLHTGASPDEHGVLKLSDPKHQSVPSVWDVLSRHGNDVFVCGSMNAESEESLAGFLLPDPWSTHVSARPRGEFDSFLDFVRANVQEHSNPETASTRTGALRFLSYMIGHGLSFDTIVATLRQLRDERRGGFHWRRACLLDKMQWDVFHHYYRKHLPAFSTFFLNSTAHFQHAYWRNMEPELFEAEVGDGTKAGLDEAILYGYQQMDTLTGKFMELAGDDVTLVFCTAMSQQPYLVADETGGKRAYRLKDSALLTTALGVEAGFSYEPVMAEEGQVPICV